MIKDTKYYYFTPLGYNAVFESQVVGWLKYYQQDGLNWQIVRTFGIKRMSGFKTKKAESLRIQTDFNISVFTLYFFPDRYLLGSFFNLMLLLLTFSKDIIRSNKIVIQSRSCGISYSLRLLKWVLNKRIRIIFDSRGAFAEEFEYNNSLKIAKNLKKYNSLKKQEQIIVSLSDVVFCVSEKLRDYHIENQPQVDKTKFFINPCNADSTDFYFSVKERNLFRNELNVTDKFVVCYSGGLELSWQKPDVLFNFFKQFQNLHSKSFFLVLTSEVPMAQQFFNEFGFAQDTYKAFSVANNEVKGYLSAADLGVLFRDNVPMNNVASPTKFAEYLMCGLPVAISAGVGDFSKIIEQNNWGFIYDNKELRKDQFDLGFSLKDCMKLRESIASYAVKNYSKQSRIETNINIFNKL